MTDTRWRIAVDTRGWEARGRGIDLYVQNVVEQWSREPSVKLTTLAPRSGDVPSTSAEVRRISLRRAFLASIGVGSFAAVEQDQDAIFLPNVTVYPRRGSKPIVITVHDATALLHQRFFGLGDRISHRVVNVAAQLRGATRLLANSEQTCKELQQIGIDPRRIT